ncbi:MAG: apolipoprotein N-acyltransferase [Elusimicrobiaceae bacterium]|nr:apolipoprotein N-acyltransferase [Elusimicrobiaceae bacterium]
MSPIRRQFLTEQKAEKESVSFLAFFVKKLLFVLFLLLCTVSSALLFKYAYPQHSYSLLAWLALSPFVCALIRLKSFWSSVFYSWLTGTCVYAGLYYWVYVTCVEGGGLSVPMGVFCWIGLSFIMAVQFAIFGGSCFYLKKIKSLFAILAALGWAALEWAHEMLATYSLGFPWFSLGYSQWNLPQVIQIASFTGTTGISALIAFCSVSVGQAFAMPQLKRGIMQMFLAAAVFLATYGYGAYVLAQPQPRSLLRLQAALMQPNIDQYKKWSSEFEQEIMDTIAQMGAELEGKNLMLTIWPESVSPGPVQEEPYFSLFNDLAQFSGAWQLVGSNRQEGQQQYVSAFMFSTQEEFPFYDKVHLVPFGEYIPFRNIIQRLFPQIEILGALGSFQKGKWDQPLLAVSQIPFGTTICYESIFSSRWRSQARAGAKFFVNITNDAWFFDTDAPYQHLAISVLRAAELGVPVLRAANTGISAVISAKGQILSRTQLNTRDILWAGVPLALSMEETFYTRWGDWFPWVCAAIYFTILLSVMVFSYE